MSGEGVGVVERVAGADGDAQVAKSTGARLHFGVLGPLEIHVDPEGSVLLGGARRRTLLLRFLISPNRVLAADRLIEDLWEGKPPQGAASTLQSHVSHVRKVLGPDRLVTCPGGYRLTVADGEVDAQRFESDLSRARGLAADAHHRDAAEAIRGALGRWRGRAFEEVSFTEWARPEAVRLEELRATALEVLLQCELAVGRYPEVVSIASGAIAEDPFREELWASLMLGLYRQGRQAEALQAYQRLRSQLVGELGIEPTPRLMELERAILAQSPELGPTRTSMSSLGPSDPDSTVTALAAPSDTNDEHLDERPNGDDEAEQADDTPDDASDEGSDAMAARAARAVSGLSRPDTPPRPGDSLLLLDAVLTMARGSTRGTGLDPSVVDRDCTIKAGEEDEPASRARQLAHLATRMTWSVDRSVRGPIVDDALHLAAASGDPRTVATVAIIAYPAMCGPSDVDARVTLLDEALKTVDHLGDTELQLFGCLMRLAAIGEGGDPDVARRLVGRVQAIACAHDDDAVRALASAWSTWDRLMFGNLDESADRLQRFEQCRVAAPVREWAGVSAGLSHVVLRHRATGSRSPREHERTGTVTSVGNDSSLAAQAVEACARGGPTIARHLVSRAMATGFRAPDQPDWLVTQLHWADTVNGLRDQRGAARLREVLLPHRHRVASSPLSGIGGLVGPRLAGLAVTLGRHEEADALFVESAERSKRLEMRVPHAEILIARARHLFEMGNPRDQERARLLLYEALVTAERHHASATAAEARDALQQAR